MDVVLGVALGPSAPTAVRTGLAEAAVVSTAALAYTQEAEFGPISGGYYDTPDCLSGLAADDLAYSAVPDEQADADTEIFDTAPQPERRPLLVTGAALASTAFAAATALMISMTLDVTPNLVALRPDIVRTLTIPIPALPIPIPNLKVPFSGQPPVGSQAPVDPLPPPPLNRPQIPSLPAPVNSPPVPPLDRPQAPDVPAPPVAAPSPAGRVVPPGFERFFTDPFFTRPIPVSPWLYSELMRGRPPGTQIQGFYISGTSPSTGPARVVLPRAISPAPAPPHVIPDPPMVHPQPPLTLPPPPPPPPALPHVMPDPLMANPHPPFELPEPPVVDPRSGSQLPNLPIQPPNSGPPAGIPAPQAPPPPPPPPPAWLPAP